MNFIKAFGLLPRLMNHLHGPNAKAAGDDSIDDLASVPRAHRVGFDDCECFVHFSTASLSPKTNLGARLSSSSLLSGKYPTKSVSIDFGRLTSSSQWM